MNTPKIQEKKDLQVMTLENGTIIRFKDYGGEPYKFQGCDRSFLWMDTDSDQKSDCS